MTLGDGMAVVETNSLRHTPRLAWEPGETVPAHDLSRQLLLYPAWSSIMSPRDETRLFGGGKNLCLERLQVQVV